MNYFGSSKHLLGNSEAAMVAAIELYNKPGFEYRDECVAILLVNAWELLLKAVLSRNRVSIYRPKERGRPYQTVSWSEALARAEPHFPEAVPARTVGTNLRLVAKYRDASVHFYSVADFGVVFYALAQTCIMNYRDLAEAAFGRRLEDRVVWALLPLGVRPPVDALTLLSSTAEASEPGPVHDFLTEVTQVADEIAAEGGDTGRIMTIFRVHMESVKKIGDADARVALTTEPEPDGLPVIYRTQDPNTTHPLLQRDVIGRIGTLNGRAFTSYVFQAILRRYAIRENRQYCWVATDRRLTCYSHDLVAFIRRLVAADVDAAIVDYRQYLDDRRQMEQIT